MSVLLLSPVLVLTKTDYGTYFEGAQFIHFLLGPATVALALPLWGQPRHDPKIRGSHPMRPGRGLYGGGRIGHCIGAVF